MSENKFELKIQYPEKTGKQKLELLGSSFHFGRSPDSTLVIKDSFASRMHFKIFFDQDKVVVLDPGSTNGTLVNGQKIPSATAVPIRVGDKIGIGNSSYAIEVSDLRLLEEPIPDIRFKVPLEDVLASDKGSFSEDVLQEATETARRIREDAKKDAEKILSEANQALALAKEKLNTTERSTKLKLEKTDLECASRLEKLEAEFKTEMLNRKEILKQETLANAKIEADRILKAAEEVAKEEASKIVNLAKESAQIEAGKVVALAQEEAQKLAKIKLDEITAIEQIKVKEFENIENLKKIEEQNLQKIKLQQGEHLKLIAENGIVILDNQKSLAQLEDSKSLLSKQLTDLNTELNELQNQKKTLSAENVQMQNSVKELSLQCDQIKNRIEDQNKQMALLKSQAEQLKAEHDQMTAATLKAIELAKQKQELELKEFEAKKFQLTNDLATQERTNKQVIASMQKKREALESTEAKKLAELAMKQEQIAVQMKNLELGLEAKKSELNKEFDEVKKIEKEKLEEFLAKEAYQVQKRRQSMVDELISSIDRIAAGAVFELEKTLAKKVDPNITRQLVPEMKQVLISQIQIKSVQEVTKLQGKTADERLPRTRWWRHWQPFLIGSFATAFCFVIYMMTISKVNWATNPVQADMASKTQERREDLAKRKFNPEKSDGLRDSILDSVIYTNGFVEAYKDDKFKHDFAKSANLMMLKTFQIPEEKTIAAVGALASIVQTLQEKKEAIHPDFINKDLAKMKDFERQQLEGLKNILGSEVRVEALLKQQKEIFNDYQKRSPASRSN